MSVAVFAPDRRKRDLDNLGKCTCDFLTHAGLYADDSQIDWLEFRRMSVQPGAGRVIVTIEEITE
jgi:crossover junction endodeoxyribonuclease RusA